MKTFLRIIEALLLMQVILWLFGDPRLFSYWVWFGMGVGHWFLDRFVYEEDEV